MIAVQYIAAIAVCFFVGFSAHWLWAYAKSVWAFLQFIDKWSNS
jgi:hypothetical protein